MSLRVIGYRDGHPIHQDEGPGAARLLGHGGRMLLSGDLVTSTVTPLTPEQAARRKANREAAAKYRGKAK